MRGAVVDLVIALCVFGVYAACSPAGQTASVVPVVPGLAVSLHAPAGPDTVVYSRTVTRDGRDSSTGTRTVMLRTAPSLGGARQLEVVQTFPGGGGTIVDTAIAELPGLSAVAHRSHQPSKTMRFEFAGSEAVGLVATADSGWRPDSVRQELGGRIFDSNILELVISALPLREGFSAELPFFIYERGGRVPMPVAVQGRETSAFGSLGSRDAWVVSVGVPGAPATVWVDTRTGAVLRVRYEIAPRNLAFTDDRLTPLTRD